MKRFSSIVGIMALVLFVSVLVGTSDPVLAWGYGCGHHGKGFWTNLTEEQREAVQEKTKEMRSQGATREEIHTAVAEMLKGYGIEVPDDCHGPIGFGHGKIGFKANLTEEQREAIRDKTKEMRDQDATREEIRDAVAEMLKGYGIEVPDDCHGPIGFGHGKIGFKANLTEEQREAVQEKTKEMRSQDATREEIHSAVAEMLKGYGIELPENCRLLGGPKGLQRDRGGFMADLTDEQREAVHEKIKEMRDQGATRAEVHTAVAEMLKGYGIEVPEDWPGPHGRGGFGPGPGGFWEDLTKEQREAVREKIREMRSQDASREEIRAAIDEMLQEYGFDLPEKSESTSSEKTTAELNIQAQSYPNPFNPETQIAYTLSVSEKVRIQIYNVTGQLIRTYDLGYQPAGSYSVHWDGRNENGDITASGVYLYRIEGGPYEVTNRMVLLK